MYNDRVFSIIKSLLSGRSMNVVVNDQSLDQHEISPGVPQVLPFFPLYIKELPKNIPRSLLNIYMQKWTGAENRRRRGYWPKLWMPPSMLAPFFAFFSHREICMRTLSLSLAFSSWPKLVTGPMTWCESRKWRNNHETKSCQLVIRSWIMNECFSYNWRIIKSSIDAIHKSLMKNRFIITPAVLG